MNNFMPYLLVVLTTILFTIFQIDSEKQIEQLENQLEQNIYQIDSLKHEIDTLQWENQIWDFNVGNNTVHLLSAIIHVESNYNDSAHAKNEDAVGCLQIRKCMVNDINRILKRQKSNTRFTYDDRWLRHKSIEMFNIYCNHYGLISAEEIARCWNGGPQGMNNPLTVGYWRKVQKGVAS